MRNLIDRIIPRYAQKYMIICGITQLLAYFCTKLISIREFVDFSCALDSKIPLVPVWTIVYMGSYVFWIAGYIAISRLDKQKFIRLFRADCIAKIICAACFVLLPTQMARPEISGGGVFNFTLEFIYIMDTPVNLFPSMHCLFSWMVARTIMAEKQFSPAVRWGAPACAILVFLSTLFTRQHYLIDIPAGIAAAELALLISGIIERRKAKN